MSTKHITQITSDETKSFVDTKPLLIVHQTKDVQVLKPASNLFSGIVQSENSALRAASAYVQSENRLKEVALRAASAYVQSENRLKEVALRAASAYVQSENRLKEVALRAASAYVQSENRLKEVALRAASAYVQSENRFKEVALRAASAYVQSENRLIYWNFLSESNQTQNEGRSMLNHEELPKIKRILRSIGQKHSTPALRFEVHLNMRRGRYDSDAKLTRYRLNVKFSTPDDVSEEETVRRAGEINLSDLLFETIRGEYPDAKVATIRGHNGIHIPALRGSLVLDDPEHV